jgi:hypothetical protein
LGKSFKKYFDRGAVAKIHYNIEFIKQVLPMLLRPTCVYPYPEPVPTEYYDNSFVRKLNFYYSSSFFSSSSFSAGF